MSSSSPPPPRNRPIIGVSTKMYFSASRTTSYVSSLLSLLTRPLSSPPTTTATTSSSSSSTTTEEATTLSAILSQLESPIDIFLLPDFLTLQSTISTRASFSRSSFSAPVYPLLIGAQDCATEDFGPYSGEASPAVLKEIGCGMVMVGHAERRSMFGEGDEVVRQKARAVVRNGMWPLVCVGEVDRPQTVEGQGGEDGVEVAAREVIGQVEAVLEGLPDEAEVVLAYEPVWAIGAAEPAGVEHVKGVVRWVRESKVVSGREGRTRIVYGGAAGPGLWKKLEGEVDGLFLGRFAHEPEQFVNMICEVAGVEWQERW